MAAYHRLKRFVDRDLSRTGHPRSGTWSFSVAVLLASVTLSLAQWPYSAGAAVVTVLAALPTLIWSGFVAWRGYRLLRASAVRGDRGYDRRGKHLLAAEYADTESATKARRRR